MHLTLQRLLLLMALAITRPSAASGVEETFLVLQDQFGRLFTMHYASTGDDEKNDLHRYVKYEQATNLVVSQCFYKRTERPRKLSCSVIEGKSYNSTLSEHSTDGKQYSALANGIYQRYAKGALLSSVGSLQGGVFLCTKDCPTGSSPMAAIEIECAECGMDERQCIERFASRPRVATVAADEVNLRSAPGLDASVIGKLQRDQLVDVESGATSCAELPTKGYLVGRWVKVRNRTAPQSPAGWVFDPYLRYENEK